VGNLQIGVKWRFHEDAGARLAIATYPAVSVGDTSSFFRKVDATELFLPIQISRSWGSFALNAEGGYRLVKGGSPEIVFGLAAGLISVERLELLSECRGTTANGFASLTLLCQLGARRVLGPTSILGAMGAAPIDHRRPHTPTCIWESNRTARSWNQRSLVTASGQPGLSG
jgi:hypothetical protein